MDAFRSDPWGAYLVDEEPGLVLWAPSALVRFRRLLALGSILRILGAAIGGVAGISFGVTLVSVDLSVASGLGALGLVFILGGVAFALMGIGAALQSWARTALPGAARKP